MKRLELVENIRRKKSFLCVGLDPDMSKMPASVAQGPDPLFTFNKAVIDATAPYAVAYKPNLAFYESHGAPGLKAFENTVRYIRDKYPDMFIIADAKRGDIGNTARQYARTFFEHTPCDAVTVAPYMGKDSVTPFLEHDGKWTILLALTSNEGSQDFQMMKDINGHALFERVIKRSQHWGTPVNMMYVVGATRADLLQQVRALAPRHFLLVPGVGAQGGSLEEVAANGLNDECGLLVNSSRGIIHASSGDDYDRAAATAAAKLAGRMAELLQRHGVIQ